MPLYLKSDSGNVYQVEWVEGNAYDLSEPNEYFRRMVKLRKSVLLPATIAEYEAYKK